MENNFINETEFIASKHLICFTYIHRGIRATIGRYEMAFR